MGGHAVLTHRARTTVRPCKTRAAAPSVQLRERKRGMRGCSGVPLSSMLPRAATRCSASRPAPSNAPSAGSARSSALVGKVAPAEEVAGGAPFLEDQTANREGTTAGPTESSKVPKSSGSGMGNMPARVTRYGTTAADNSAETFRATGSGWLLIGGADGPSVKKLGLTGLPRHATPKQHYKEETAPLSKCRRGRGCHSNKPQ